MSCTLEESYRLRSLTYEVLLLVLAEPLPRLHRCCIGLQLLRLNAAVPQYLRNQVAACTTVTSHRLRLRLLPIVVWYMGHGRADYRSVLMF